MEWYMIVDEIEAPGYLPKLAHILAKKMMANNQAPKG
jgi:hypothetical protein